MNVSDVFLQRSIVEACQQFPDKLSCHFHVTQQRAEVDPHLQPFVRSKLHKRRVTEGLSRSASVDLCVVT